LGAGLSEELTMTKSILAITILLSPLLALWPRIIGITTR